MLKKIFFLASFLFAFNSILAEEELTIERLELLKERGSISHEDYLFLKDELHGNLEEKHYFSLFVNRTAVSNDFPVIQKNSKSYISLKKFFETLNYKNYSFTNNILDLRIGTELEEIMIDFNSLKIVGSERTNFSKDDFFFHGNELFIESQLFSDLFLNAIDIDYTRTRISVSTKYSTPDGVNELLGLKEEKIGDANNMTDFYYTNSRDFFNLGYLRVNLEQEFFKTEGDKSSDWDGYLEYQGSFLYGELTTNYDLRENELTGANLYYPNLPYNHYLEIYGDKNEGGSWKKSLLLQKDKGYFEEGKQFVIRENVPIGSRVELVYLGATIDIGYEEDGVVEFRNSELKADREYLLRIHTKDGKRVTRIIKTNDDFNQQNRGEFEYRFFTTETETDGKNDYDTAIYYGLTDRLTLGGTYFKTFTTIDDKDGYLERAGADFIYSNFYKTNAYSIVLKTEQILSNHNLREDTSFQGLAQMKFKKFKLKYEGGEYSDYYNEKNSNKATIEFDPFSFLSINYSYVWLEEWDRGKRDGNAMSIELRKNYNRFLTTLEMEEDISNEVNYSLNFYYTGYRDYSVKWSNSVSEMGDDFQSTLALFNRSRQNGFDYAFEISYDEKEREKFTFRFSLDYDNWFRFDSKSKDNGDYEMSVGLDRVIDLKNIKTPLNNMDVSRVKVITYLDKNDNNIFDSDENYIGDVEVEIDGVKKVTTSIEPTYFYGVPNNITYNFKPVVRRPSYDTVNSKFSLKGKGGGDIEALIPVKPLYSITGTLSIEDKIVDSMSFYEGVVVKILNSKGDDIMTTLLDFTGQFDVSGLNSGKYTLEISSFKDDGIKPLIKELSINYNEVGSNLLVVNTILKNNTIMIKE
ncbi:MAG: hypothetical protein ACRDAT_06555 [Cetobacterium sp.]